jgi:hypothetical protein
MLPSFASHPFSSSPYLKLGHKTRSSPLTSSSLLATHAIRIDTIEAFDLLPPLVSVKDIKVYLEKTLRRSGERKREAMMVKGVEKSWQEEKEWRVVELEERRVKISEGRVYVFFPSLFCLMRIGAPLSHRCPVCHKRIGNSVVAIHNPQCVSFPPFLSFCC